MQVLLVTSEAYPLIKTGGLADVSSALPKALKNLKAFKGDIKILLPGYTAVLDQIESPKKIATIDVLGQTCTLLMGKMPKSQSKQNADDSVDVIAIQNTFLYERSGGPYNDEDGEDWSDNALRFAVLSRVASLLCSEATPYKAWRPTLVHCNDWQTGLVPAYMKLVDHSTVKSIFSIHNLAFQGCFDASYLSTLELPISHFNMNGFEYHEQISFLKAGLFYADKLSTVSPTYADEIQTPTFGFGMEGLLQTRKDDLVGILNGIDTLDWNPAIDEYLPKHYTASRITGKKAVKKHLQQQLGLEDKADSPLLGVVSRFTHQKGLDLLPAIIPQLVAKGCQFAILGSGDSTIEAKFKVLAKQYPSQVSVTVDYNESLSHNIMAGTDIFVMPSRFEPCGLNQMYGMAYGTPPIVSPTGGLADSVVDSDEATIKQKTATGFVLDEVSTTAMLAGVTRAITYWRDKPIWRGIQRNGMQLDLSWESRAQAYLQLYQALLLT
ncbi:MAG: glycogen synthase GlgA [Methylophilaceae bacterium]